MIKKEDRIISIYKELNTIPIPKRSLIAGVITDDLYYIVWEDKLTKPKIFKYAWASGYHASKYAEKYLKGKPYNVLPGSTLLEFGIKFADLSLYEAVGIGHGTQSKYHFHPELSQQRKKTLRNLYRRNARRLLRKLLILKTKKR